MIDHKHILPKYYQLKIFLKRKILSENLKNGDLVPSEPSLCREFEVSVTTVRRCLRELVEEGLLYREQGKGTFVADP